MKTLKDYSGRLNNYQEKEQKEILNTFVNELIMDMNASLTMDDIKHLQFRMHEQINSTMSIKHLRKIRFEIVSNFRKYSPFCFASIVTADKNLKDG